MTSIIQYIGIRQTSNLMYNSTKNVPVYVMKA